MNTGLLDSPVNPGNDETGHEEVKTMQLTIRMPQEYNEKIETLAEKMGLKKSDIARLALKEFIEENIAEDDSVPYDRVKHLLGVAESGIKDLGQRHREHLIKKIRKGS
ncbi:MAG: ribbon-helix-helix domain-containing protein [Desulfobacterota bacterium]|jgi:predicted DNA-binding protein|nr:ribbon-helix-helix domain-containing protein [Thermodesulfobacteriota bacterium]